MRKRIQPTSILSDAEVKAAVALLRSGPGKEFAVLAKTYRISAEDTFRFLSVSERFRQAREKRALSIKEVAATLKVPQYRIKAIENGRFTDLDATVLVKYAAHLGLSPWLGRWKRANAELAVRLGLPQPRGRGTRTKTG